MIFQSLAYRFVLIAIIYRFIYRLLQIEYSISFEFTPLHIDILAQRNVNHTWKAPSSMYVTDHNIINLSTPLSSLSLCVFNQNVTGELACLWVASGGAQKSQQPSAPPPHNYFHNKQHRALGYTARRNPQNWINQPGMGPEYESVTILPHWYCLHISDVHLF